jgi:hypothetical protein
MSRPFELNRKKIDSVGTTGIFRLIILNTGSDHLWFISGPFPDKKADIVFREDRGDAFHASKQLEK